MAKKSLLDDVAKVQDAVKVSQEVATLRNQLATAHRVIADQQERIEQISRKRFRIGKSTAKNRNPGKTHTRVIVPDSHGCFIDKAAAAAFLSDLELLAPDEVVWLGDHIDCGGFLAEHHTLGYVAQAEYTFTDDCIAANTFIDQVQAITPKAKHRYLAGNHERRLETWCATTSLRNATDAAMLYRLFSAPAVLHLEERGIDYYDQGKFYDGCRIPGTIKLGKCYFTHGSKHGKKAADQMLARFNAPVCFGHVHKLLAASDRNVKDGELAAWCCGYLGQLQPLWRHTDPTDWVQGYAFQVVRSDGEFLHINCPIIGGKSYLVQLSERVGKA